MRGKKRKILSLVAAAVVIAAAFGSLNYIFEKTDDDICAAAVSNLSGNLSIVSAAEDRMMEKEAENLQKIAAYIADKEDPEDWIEEYCAIDGMMPLAFVDENNTAVDGGLSIPLDELEFTDEAENDSLLISKSYQDSDGNWLYAMACPVVYDGQSIGRLYGEVAWASIESVVSDSLYGDGSVLVLMDGLTDSVVVPPKDTLLTEFVNCDSLDSFLAAAQMQDDFMKEIFHQSAQEGQSIMFQCDIDGVSHYIYMWPVNDDIAYMLGMVPTDTIMQEVPIVRHTIKFVITVIGLVSGLIIAIILIETIRRQRIQKVRAAEREAHNVQLQEALDYAKAANASKTMFLSNMSHDIRTPMNAIIGFSSLLANDPSNEEKVKEYTQKITSSSQHLMNLINEILDISKIESGNVVLNIETFSVEKFVNDIEMMTRPMMEAKNQKYEICLGNMTYDALMGDVTRLTQIMVNLLTNASKYTQSYGEISWSIDCVRVSDKYQRLRFEVKDTGIGMSEDYQKIIFEPFTRAESSTTNKVQGTGLGMAITKNLVDMMGGAIEIHSKEGKGSTFAVEITFRVSENENKAFSDKASSAISVKMELPDMNGTLEGRHFLIAEDNALNMEIIQALLEAEGVQCDMAENGQEAVDIFAKHEPGTYDAILMDVMMPVMDGYEATKRIRSLKREDAQKIPILAITANAFSEDIRKAMDAGMNAHISKPLNPEALRRTLLPFIEN